MRNPDAVEAIKIVAHRGYASAYPENTLPAVIAAVEAGVMSVEVDIQFSKDGVPLLIHDTDFGCIANTNQKVFETDIADIKKIAVCERDKCNGSSTDVFYCTLDELAEYIQLTPGLRAFIEIKQEGIDLFGAEFVIQQLEQSLKNIRERCKVISYSAAFLKKVHQYTEFSIGYILTLWNDEYLKQAHLLQPEFVICNFTKIPASTNFHEYPWQWMLYEITECEQLFYYAKEGVQWVEGMDPVKLLACLHKNISVDRERADESS